MKKNGFTLIELLATIVIMSLILAMVVPAINSLRNTSKNKSYELYGDMMIEAAKAYVSKEGEDLTSLGTEDWNGCVLISLDQLIASDLLKTYSQVRNTGEEDKNITCTGTVKYTKLKKNASVKGTESPYDYKLTCREGSKELYKKTLTSTTCNIPVCNQAGCGM